jgi:hypothetical protein
MDIGTHRARAVDVVLGYAGTGTPQIAVAFEVTEGDCAGETITWYGYFTEKTQQRTIESLRHAGWKGNDIGELTAADLTSEVDIVVNEEEGVRGDLRKRVSWVNRVGTGGAAIKNRMDDSAKRSFAAKLKGLCIATPVVADAPQRASGTDDEIPF